jgi:hypothetical protein
VAGSSSNRGFGTGAGGRGSSSKRVPDVASAGLAFTGAGAGSSSNRAFGVGLGAGFGVGFGAGYGATLGAGPAWPVAWRRASMASAAHEQHADDRAGHACDQGEDDDADVQLCPRWLGSLAIPRPRLLLPELMGDCLRSANCDHRSDDCDQQRIETL